MTETCCASYGGLEETGQGHTECAIISLVADGPQAVALKPSGLQLREANSSVVMSRKKFSDPSMSMTTWHL